VPENPKALAGRPAREGAGQVPLVGLVTLSLRVWTVELVLAPLSVAAAVGAEPRSKALTAGVELAPKRLAPAVPDSQPLAVEARAPQAEAWERLEWEVQQPAAKAVLGAEPFEQAELL
jgi:hypothetical protein